MDRRLKKLREAYQGIQTYPPDEKYTGMVPEIKYLPVSVIHRKEMDWRPEVTSVSPEVATNMNYGEPVEVTAYRYSSDNTDTTPEVTLTDGHHRYAAAMQTGREWLPVEVQAINAKGYKLNSLIQMSNEIAGE